MKSKVKVLIALTAAVLRAMAPGVASAQTAVDLRTQVKSGSADLSAVGPTKPAQTGNALPATCTVGEVFFLTTALEGTNLRICGTANIWSQAGGRITLKADGTEIGATASLNLTSTEGSTISVNPAGGDVNVSVSPNSSVFATRELVRSGLDNYCTSTSANSTTYTCVEQAPLKVYSEGMRLLWAPDVSCAGGVPITLNVDGIGARRVLQNNGNADPLPSQCAARSQVLLAYSGALNSGAGGWRMMSGPGGSNPSIPRMIAYPFDGGGVVLPVGKVVYIPDVPFSCTIAGWSMAVDQGTATADIWVGSDGTAVPTSSDSITASAPAAITSGTRVRSTAMPGWKTLLSAHSSLAFQLKSVTGATQVTVGVECDQ